MSLLLKYKYKYKIAQIAQGKSIVHISEKNIKNINIKIPCIEFYFNFYKKTRKPKSPAKTLETNKKRTITTNVHIVRLLFFYKQEK